MSRLNAEARGLYYRTQDPLAEPLAAVLELPEVGVVNVLDPCAGAAIFLQRLFEQLGVYAEERGSHATLVSYGIEPNRERAAQAQTVFTHFLRADFFTVMASRSRFQLAMLNPPYDADVTSSDMDEGGQERLEIRFLRKTTQLLAPKGVLVLIVPQAQLVPAARHLAANYTQLRCWRYPDVAWSPPEELGSDGKPRPPTPLYQQFHQVVLIGTRRTSQVAPAEGVVRQISDWALAGEALPPLPLDRHMLAGIQRWHVPADSDGSDLDRSHGQHAARLSHEMSGSNARPVAAPDAAKGGEHFQYGEGGTPVVGDAPSALNHHGDLFSGVSTPTAADSAPPEGLGSQSRLHDMTDTAALTGVQQRENAASSLPPIVFSSPAIELERLATQLDMVGGGVWADAAYREQRWPDIARLRLGMERPLGPLRLGHLITLAAVGLLNGRVLEGPDARQLLVKGACRKTTVITDEIERAPEGRETLTRTETEKFVIALWAIDLATGGLIHIV